MTVLILAIDALDAELVDYFDIDAFRLESDSKKRRSHTRKTTYSRRRYRPVSLLASNPMHMELPGPVRANGVTQY